MGAWRRSGDRPDRAGGAPPAARAARRQPLLGAGAPPRRPAVAHRRAGPALAADRAARRLGPRRAGRVRFDAEVAPLLARALPAEDVRVLLVRRPGAAPGRLRPPVGLRRQPARPRGGLVVGARDRRRPARRPAGTAPSASRRAGRSTWSARTAATTPAAPARPARSPRRCPRPAGATSGSAGTSAATGSRPTLVVLPHGFYYGQVDPATAPSWWPRTSRAGGAALAARPGRVPAPAQAAQHYARQALGETGLDALRPIGLARLAADRWRVRLAAPGGGALLVTVRAGLGPPVRLTCSSRTAEPPRHWELVALRPAPPA